MSWQKTTLGETVDLLAGFAFKSAQFTDEPDGVRLLRGDNIAQGLTRWDGVKRWPQANVAGLERYWLKKDDVVLAMDRPWIEAGLKFASIRDADLPSLLVQRVARLRSKAALDQVFLKYVIAAKAFTDHVQAITTGANVPHISGRDILAYSFELPRLGVQRRIADILSAYDDLIENNTRRIAILEDMARRLFAEWFGQGVEADWPTVKLGTLAAINPEAIKPKSPPARIGYIDIASVSPGKVDQVQWMDFAEAPGRARRIVRNGDVIWSNVRPNRRSFALLLDVDQNTIASTGFSVLRAKTVPWSYLYVAITTSEFTAYLTNRAKGSAYPAVGSEDFADADVLRPTDETLRRFHDHVGPMLELAARLNVQSANLRTTRDLLLPKLISGEIEVRAVEKEMEAAAA